MTSAPDSPRLSTEPYSESLPDDKTEEYCDDCSDLDMDTSAFPTGESLRRV